VDDFACVIVVRGPVKEKTCSARNDVKLFSLIHVEMRRRVKEGAAMGEGYSRNGVGYHIKFGRAMKVLERSAIFVEDRILRCGGCAWSNNAEEGKHDGDKWMVLKLV
jgi:hypothetical protein